MTWVLLMLVSLTAATAQIIMKYAAVSANELGGFLTPRVLALVLSSFFVSSLGQLLWFYVLRFSSLSTSYLFLSLVFIIVPVAGALLFAERLQTLHYFSIGLILTGVALLGFVEQGK